MKSNRSPFLPKKKTSCKRLFNKFDIYAEPVSFYYKEDRKVRTSLGAFISLFIIASSALIFFQNVIRLSPSLKT